MKHITDASQPFSLILSPLICGIGNSIFYMFMYVNEFERSRDVPTADNARNAHSIKYYAKYAYHIKTYNSGCESICDLWLFFYSVAIIYMVYT